MKILGLKSSKVYSENPTGVKQNKKAYNTSFSANPITQEEEETKKKGISVKKLTNMLGTLAGIGIILAAGIYNGKRPKWMKILDKEKGTLETKINTKIEQMNIAVRKSEGKEERGGFLYRFGAGVQNFVNKIGDELSNNLLYGIGTVAIMPLVIAFSPFGKKDSSKEDKFFAIARQPLSFITMFSIQLTNDKMFSRWSKSLTDQNWLENKEIVDATTREIKKDGEKYSEDVINKIKYNSKPIKEYFEKMFEETKIDKSKLDNIYKIKDTKTQSKEFEKLLKEHNIGENLANKLKKTLTHHANVAGTSKLVTESIKIVSNILVSQVIGCTLLNVIYGKVMKGWTQHKEEAAKNKINNQEQNLNVASNEGKVA